MASLDPIVPATVVGTVLLFAAAGRKKKKKKRKVCQPNYVCDEGFEFDLAAGECGECVPAGGVVEPPPGGCGLYPWLPDQVDAEIEIQIEAGVTDPDELTLRAARAVYPLSPEGDPQLWPAAPGDSRAECLWDRILIRVNLILAQKADDDADDADDDDDGWDPYPPPGPVDVWEWEQVDNYPEPGKFHQIYYQGKNNSATTLKHIAQKAIAQRVMQLTGDLSLAQSMSDDAEIWRSYRDLIDCSPWNDAAYGVTYKMGPHKYDTPHGRQIGMNPVHDDVRKKLTQGQPPRRTVKKPNAHSGGGHFAYLWLPPLDDEALLEGVVRVDPTYWSTGDSKIMPPPEVLTLGLENVPKEQTWGCLGFETTFEPEAPFDAELIPMEFG